MEEPSDPRGAGDLTACASAADREPPSSYFLCADGHYCVSGSFAVFLSLGQDRYFAVPASDLFTERGYRSLLRAGVLACTREGGKAFQPTVCRSASGDLALNQWASRAGVRTRGCTQPFVTAIARAEYDLRRIGINNIVARVRARAATAAALYDSLWQHTAEFQSLRPWYWRMYRCLFDSLALLYYLEAFDLRPNWVFGVRSEPFDAHCWLQVEEIVVNDSFEKVAAYTPILVV